MQCELCAMVASGLNVAGLFQLPASVQRSVLYCLVSMIKLDRDHGQVGGFVNCRPSCCISMADC